MWNSANLENFQQEVEKHDDLPNAAGLCEFFVRIAGMVDGLSEEQKNEENRVQGCQTNAWVVAEKNNGRMQYYVDSDSLIVKGMLNVLADILSNHTSQEISDSEWTLWEQAGILENLTESRNNGIRAAEQRMRSLAVIQQ